ncbi:maternal protein tudor-like [Ylistrum balloti]|uniref:maternal protein tudor-like n=1 Tax=Ylistrum balloti TaxID=509963 RepID=UPI00290585D7|nr:maternal protein tudor-like [Ylistrum balloti]
MDEWDPRQDDFKCEKFNTYDRGPGQFLPSKIERSKSEGIQLYISGIPNDLTEEGLYNLFSQAGECLRLKKCVSKNPDAGDTYGFVTMLSVSDADRALSRFNNFNIGRFRMRVRIAISEEEMKKRKEKKLEEEEFIKSLPSQRQQVKKTGTSSDTDNSSGGQTKVSMNSKGKQRNRHDRSNGHIDKASAQHYPMPSSHEAHGGYPFERADGLAARGMGLLGEVPNSPYYHQAYSYDPSGIVGNTYHYGNNGRTMTHIWGTAVYDRQENFMQGQGRGYYGGQRRGRGAQHHYQEPYINDFQYQGVYGPDYMGGYGRGHAQGPLHFSPMDSYQGAGRGHYTNKHHMGYGRGQSSTNQTFRGARRGGYFAQNFHSPVPHHSSMESLNSVSSTAQNKQKKETRPCALCEKPGSYRCSRCKTSYCSENCQRKHWDVHKDMCHETETLQKKMEKEDEDFGEITIGEDLIEKMVAGGALEKVEVKNMPTKTPQTANGKSGKQSKPQKISPKSVKSPSSKEKSSISKASPQQQEREEKDSNGRALSNSSIDMVPLQVKRRAADTKEPIVKMPPSPPAPKQVRGKAFKISELPTGLDIQVLVSEVVDPHLIWLQLHSEENHQALSELMTQMTTLYDKETNAHVACPVVGDAYAAQFSLDNKWYRAKVEAFQGSDAVKVTYLDFGNQETMALTRLRQLKDSMVALPALAVKCSLADVSPLKGEWGDAVNVLKSLIPATLESAVIYTVKAQSKEGDYYIVDMLDRNGENVREKLVQAGVVKVSQGSSQAAESVSSPILYSSLPLNEKVKVLTMDVSSPGEIWVQEGNIKKVEHGLAITDDLNKKVNEQKLNPVTEVKPGEMYAAYSAKDIGWYRARVDSLRDDGTVNVTYVEFGNKENVSLSQMKELDSALKSEPLTGVHLVLHGIAPLPGETTWSDDAITTLKELVLLSDVSKISYIAEAVGRNVSSTLVRMTDNEGCDIADKLVEVGVVRTNVASTSTKTAASPKQSDASKTELKKISIMAKSLGSVADKLAPNDVVAIMITDAVSPVNFVIQLNQESLIRPFAAFSSNINTAMQDVQIGYKPKQVGELILGLYEGSWYRAEVISLTDKEAEVCFIDFGNSERKEFSELSAAIEVCGSLPAQSVKCCLHGVTAPDVWPQEVLQSFAELKESPLEAEFKCMVKDIAMIDIMVGDEGISAAAVINQVLENIKSGTEPQVSTVPTSVQTANHEVGSSPVSDTRPIMASDVSMETLPFTIEEAVVSSIVDFESFYIQLLKSESEIAEVQQNMSVYCDTACPYTPVEGELICAKFSADKQWYRAKVIDVLGEDQFTTQFVDYGNCDEVNKDSIRKPIPSLKSLPCQSIHCKLQDVTNEGQSQDTLQDFAQLVSGCKVQVEAKQIDNGVYSVLLTTAEGVDINNRFQVERASSHQLSPHPHEPRTSNIKLSEITRFEPKERNFEVIITYVVTPEEFYCQLTNQESIQALSLLQQNIMLHCAMENTNPEFRPEVGELCCARFTDLSWYRAVVMKIFQDDTLLVHFIDFGNSEIVARETVRPISPEYTELPITAFKCSLHGVMPIGKTWSKEASDKLWTYSGPRLMIEIFDKVGDLHIVDLSAEDSKVSDNLVDSGFANRAQAEAADEAASIQEQIAALQAQLLAIKKKEG